ncbi:aldehyde dehydrogenase (NADP(+)) [Hyphomonas sp.]|uniref:aldehyde dehydrogenase (NADP(+)) n=1 Tax=Hyphomonas sp. TaxID=87 RepID=UPI00391A1349
MTETLSGYHLIEGEWHASDKRFKSLGLDGLEFKVSSGGAPEIDLAARAAHVAFKSYSQTTREQRAAFLEKIADCIEARAEDITAAGTAETGLPAARLNGERGRTTGQLRLFAEHIRAGGYLDRRHTPAQPDRQPAPRPDLRLVQRPIGPVAVFGASNFPLAFSTAGGDTAAALAAGCPVVVKAHPAHPRTGELVARAISEAIEACGMPAGVFGFVQGETHEVGAALVSHPLIRAAAFTGSLRAGRALFDICAARPEPIPFYGEFGSVNPVFLLPDALRERATQIGEGWATSLTLGAGQFCTNPGIVFAAQGSELDAFTSAAITALNKSAPQIMLTDAIAASYKKGCNHIREVPGVETLVAHQASGRLGAPSLFRASFDAWLSNPVLAEEVFGPAGIIVVLQGPDDFPRAAETLSGQLTATIHMQPTDHDLAVGLLPSLERIAGRILFNGFPTGVEVADAMVHSGPYPATSNFGATSVGTMAIRRFLRPVCYQDMPEGLWLPDFS